MIPQFSFASRKCSITPTIKELYFLYFCCKVGKQNKSEHHTCATLRGHSNLMRGWMAMVVVYCLKCPNFGEYLPITELTVISLRCPYSKCYVHEEKITTNCQTQTRPSIRSQKASSVTWTGVSNFPKIKQNFMASRLKHWNLLHHPVKWQHFAPETKNSSKF